MSDWEVVAGSLGALTAAHRAGEDVSLETSHLLEATRRSSAGTAEPSPEDDSGPLAEKADLLREHATLGQAALDGLGEPRLEALLAGVRSMVFGRAFEEALGRTLSTYEADARSAAEQLERHREAVAGAVAHVALLERYLRLLDTLAGIPGDGDVAPSHASGKGRTP